MTTRASVLAIAAVTTLLDCHTERWPGAKTDALGPSATPAARSLPAPDAQAAESTALSAAPLDTSPHPRILLTTERMAAVTELAHRKDPRWRELLTICDESASKDIPSGYEAEDWGHVAVDLALAYKVTGKDAYARAALRYMTALVDDYYVVGDHKGGDAAVQANNGYSIRSRGFLAAIAYDWLHDRMTKELRAHMIERFFSFHRWYAKDGYRHNEAISNHYMAYFGHTAMAGIATLGDDPRGATMQRSAREMWRTQIVPQYRTLSGGDYPEGWQYARLIGAVLGIYIDAEARHGAPTIATELPWLRESVAFQTHAFFPDGKRIFDNADWTVKPAEAMSDQLHGAAVAFPPGDPATKRALFLARRAVRGGWRWLRVIADPARAAEDPRTGPTSYLARGTGTLFARTDWGGDAVWASLNSGPFFGDHQHLDQGHFEVVRGGDALLIDPGDYDSYATTSHNSILVDDRKEHMRWTPNQGVWCKDCAIERFEDHGAVVYAEADFTTAYDPDGYPRYRKDRAVTRAQRSFLFSRADSAATKTSASAARLVLYDRVTVTKPTYGVIWAGHASTTPEVDGSTVRIVVGTSRAQVTTLVPSGARAKLLTEPTLQTDDLWMKNDPAAGIASTRIEIASPNGLERRFLNAIVIGGRADPATTVTRIDGEGAVGAAIAQEAYIFPVAAPQRLPSAMAYASPPSVTRHIVTGLAPDGHYSVTIRAQPDGHCQVALLPAGGAAGARSASSSGLMLLDATGCILVR